MKHIAPFIVLLVFASCTSDESLDKLLILTSQEMRDQAIQKILDAGIDTHTIKRDTEVYGTMEVWNFDGPSFFGMQTHYRATVPVKSESLLGVNITLTGKDSLAHEKVLTLIKEKYSEIKEFDARHPLSKGGKYLEARDTSLLLMIPTFATEKLWKTEINIVERGRRGEIHIIED